ncbi:fatty acid--CoA ligase family protein [Paenibacillaceae bacterium WGS1546]|uniref:ANL family adenylate-forming protein n=1 Tax=Cohnella sp. WGS1546 TaxID=3366810 RepID=UPI00372D458C
MSLFWIDDSRGIAKTYEQLTEDLNRRDYGKTYIYEQDPYEAYVHVLHSMLAGYEVVCLDGNLSDGEIRSLGIEPERVNAAFAAEPLRIGNAHELLQRVKVPAPQWGVSIFTSGTTGQPKVVKHRLATLARAAKVAADCRSHVWALAYHPTRFAGFQVFFQALLNGNPIVSLCDLAARFIPNALERHRVTHLSATPTFYRTLLPYVAEPLPAIRSAACGGERCDEALFEQLKQAFPSASVRNIYASTEAGSLFSASGDLFSVPERWKSFVSVSDQQELLIHRSLLAGGGEFIPSEDEWYATGDLVERRGENQFVLVSRKTEMINVGGYKVNPHEIEAEIRKLPGVRDCLVKPRANRLTGNLLTASVVKDGSRSEEQIADDIARLQLQSWKIPRIVEFAEQLPTTTTGKMVRR